MSLKDYFEMGRQKEIDYERKQSARKVIKKVTKPSPFSFGGIIFGLGVLYQILYPPLVKLKPRKRMRDSRVADVIRSDMKMLIMKIRGVNPEWELFKQFDNLSRGKK
jgi:hypothetical protein